MGVIINISNIREIARAFSWKKTLKIKISLIFLVFRGASWPDIASDPRRERKFRETGYITGGI